MNKASCTKSCDRLPDILPGTVMTYDAQYSQPRFMDSGLCPAREVPTESYPLNNFNSPTEGISLLNIPSIYETMNNSCFDEPSAGKHLGMDWNWRRDQSEGISNEADRLCDDAEDEENNTNASKDIPREPLKRLRRQRANDRERRRMKSLNGALNNLKKCIPLPKTKRRVTKLEILRIACNYIQSLWETLNGSSEGHVEPLGSRGGNEGGLVNGMSVTQRLSLLSSNLKFNFQLQNQKNVM